MACLLVFVHTGLYHIRLEWYCRVKVLDRAAATKYIRQVESTGGEVDVVPSRLTDHSITAQRI